MNKADVYEYLIRKGPGRTELELAQAVHGEDGYQQNFNTVWAELAVRGTVERRGQGYAKDPYRYYPTSN